MHNKFFSPNMNSPPPLLQWCRIVYHKLVHPLLKVGWEATRPLATFKDLIIHWWIFLVIPHSSSGDYIFLHILGAKFQCLKWVGVCNARTCSTKTSHFSFVKTYEDRGKMTLPSFFLCKGKRFCVYLPPSCGDGLQVCPSLQIWFS